MIDISELCNRTYDITTDAGVFKVRKFTKLEIVSDKLDKDPHKRADELISIASVEPHMTPEQAGNLPYDVYKQLETGIMDLNGLSEKGKEAIQGNSTEIQAGGSSSK